MKCPFCEFPDSKVLDSRSTEDNEQIRRRRECLKCGNRFTTYEKIEKILRAGMAAPSAVNKQPWKFVVIKNREVLNKLAEANRGTRMAAQAPLAIAVCGDTTKAIEGEGREFWVQDASAATENILLAAHSLGLGAVWTGIYPIKERTTEIGKILELPDYQIVLCVIPIGYPAENPEVKDKWNTDNIKYIN
jgi:nitroreductase